MFPETFFTSKPNLALILRDADYHPNVCSFSNETCQTALEKFNTLLNDVKAAIEENEEDNAILGRKGIWICKPGSSCRGKDTGCQSVNSKIHSVVAEVALVYLGQYTVVYFLIKITHFNSTVEDRTIFRLMVPIFHTSRFIQHSTYPSL